MNLIRLTLMPYRMCNGPRLAMLKLVYGMTRLNMRDTYRLCRRLDAGMVVQLRVNADDVSDFAEAMQSFGIIGIRQEVPPHLPEAIGVVGSCLTAR